MVAFDVAKNRFYIPAPFFSFGDAFFGFEFFFGHGFMPYKVVVYFYHPVVFCLMVYTSRRAAMAILCLVFFCSLLKACAALLFVLTNAVHWLAHRAVIAIFVLIIVELLCGKGMLFLIAACLLLIKIIVLHKSFYHVVLQVLIIFFTSIACIGCKTIGVLVVGGFVLSNVFG